MIKQYSGAALIFFLAVTFLALKCSPSHAHLNSLHDHDSEQHRHSIQAHSHQPVVFHADTIDADHQQMNEARVVELDHDQSPSNGKKLDHPEALAAIIYYAALIQSGEVGLTEGGTLLARLLHPHPGQPRAPPQLT